MFTKNTVLIIALIAATSFVSGCFLKPQDKTVEHSGSDAPVLSKCEKDAQIENADDGNSQIMTNEGRSGYLWTYSEDKGTMVEPSGDFVVSRGGVDPNGFALRMKGILVNSSHAFAGMGFSMSDPDGPYDGSKYTGVSFVAKANTKGAHWVRFMISDSNTNPHAGICKECDNNFGVNFPLTDEWQKFEVNFDDMKQEDGWGNPTPEKVASDAIWGMMWQVNTPGAAFNVWVDEVQFIGGCSK